MGQRCFLYLAGHKFCCYAFLLCAYVGKYGKMVSHYEDHKQKPKLLCNSWQAIVYDQNDGLYRPFVQRQKIGRFLLTQPLPPLQLRSNIPLRLMASIMSQQLRTKVAKVIYHRFLAIYNGDEPTPQQVLATDTEVLSAIGLSYAKIKYIQNVAVVLYRKQDRR